MDFKTQLFVICGFVIVVGVALIWACFKLERNEKFATKHPRLPNVIGFCGWLVVVVGISGFFMYFVMVQQGYITA